MKELIKALKCSARPGEHDDCSKCRYRVLEEAAEFFKIEGENGPKYFEASPPDVTMDGKKYWESCNCEKMAMDAAEALERLTEDDLK